MAITVSENVRVRFPLVKSIEKSSSWGGVVSAVYLLTATAERSRIADKEFPFMSSIVFAFRVRYVSNAEVARLLRYLMLFKSSAVISTKRTVPFRLRVKLDLN